MKQSSFFSFLKIWIFHLLLSYLQAFPIIVHGKILKCFWSQNISELSPLKMTYFCDFRMEIGVSLNILKFFNFDTIRCINFPIITFRYKIYRFCKNILYCFHLLREKYRVVEKFGVSLRPEVHIQTITPLFKWQLPTLKTEYNRLIRFLLKNILSYLCKLNQCFKQTFQWSGGIELIWIGFPNQNKGTHQRRNCFMAFQSKNVSKKEKKNWRILTLIQSPVHRKLRQARVFG